MSEFAFYPLLGMPVIVIGGIISYLLFFVTTIVFYLTQSGINIVPFKYHQPLAIISLIIGAFHIFVAVVAFM